MTMSAGGRRRRSLLLFDRLLDKAERVGVFDQRPHLRTLEPRWNLRLNLKLQLRLSAWQRGELLHDRLDNLMHVSGWSVR